MTDRLDQHLERIRKQEQEDLRTILKTVYGRRFVWRVLARCGVHRLSFDQDPIRMAFNEGQRNIGNTLLAEVLEVRPESYVEMTKMAKEEEDVRKAIQEAQAAAD